MTKYAFIPAMTLCVATVAAQTSQFRRPRGAALYKCESANTTGAGNVWITGRAIGFIWDAKKDATTLDASMLIRGFIEARADLGLFNIASVSAESRIISYPWEKRLQFGNIAGMVKFTTPNNKDLRLHGAGIEFKYLYSSIKDFNSLGGFRLDGSGTGFSPEGIIVGGGTIGFMALYDLDLVQRVSFLPLKLLVNFGFRIPTQEEYRPFSQYVFNTGVSFTGSNFEVFAEYSLEAFLNKSTEPKQFSFDWWGGSSKRWEVAFSENPMYLTLGGKICYPNGVSLLACVPLLLSSNRGSTMEYSGCAAGGPHTLTGNFDDECSRNVTDGFDPWYAKWKVIAQILFPVHYRQTGAEMRRNFLLMKNKGGVRKIDIDERIRLDQEDTEPDEGGSMEKDGEVDKAAKKKRRLETIRKKRRQFEEQNAE